MYKILKLDIRSFDVVSRTVTIDFELKHYRYGLMRTRSFTEVGNAIIIVGNKFIPDVDRTLKKIREETKIVWYWPNSNYDSKRLDTDELFKDVLRDVAYDTIWEIKRSLENWRY